MKNNSSLIPKLRFREFTDEWQVKKLGDISTKVGSGSTPRGGSEVYRKSGTPFIRSQNITNGRLELDNVVYIDKKIHDTMSNSKIKPNDVLLNITGASLGRTCVVPANFTEGNLNQHVCIIRLMKSTNPYLVHTLLSQPKGLHDLLKTQTGGGKEGLNFQAVRAFKVALPLDTDEQQKIVEFLGGVDDKLASIQSGVTAMHKYKQGVMQALFSGKLRFKDENGNPYPDWQEKTISDVTNFIKDGTHGTHPDSDTGEYLLLSAKNIKNGEVLHGSNDRRISKNEFESIQKNYTLVDGDILLTIVGTIGNVAIWDEQLARFAFQRSVAFLRFTDLTSDYAFQLLNSYDFQKSLKRRSVVSAQPGVYLGDIAKISIKVPSKAEQEKIANFLRCLDDKIKIEEEKLNQAKNFKKSLLQRMFV